MKRTWMVAWIAVSLLAGCNLPVTSPIFPPTLSPAPISRSTIPPGLRLPSPTNLSSSRTQPSSRTLPGPASVTPGIRTTAGLDTRVNFTQGATQAELSGALAPGGQVGYLVFASKGQRMMLEVDSPNREVILAVTGMEGSVLAADLDPLTAWQGFLPYTGDYRITLTSPRASSQYNLRITIPVSVQFSSGATTVALQGQVSPGASVSYLVYALGGQATRFAVKSESDQVRLTVVGVNDGYPVVPVDSSVSQWTGILPASQYYLIQVLNLGKELPFLLQISIQ